MAQFESAGLGKATVWCDLFKSASLYGEGATLEPSELSSPSKGRTANLSLTVSAKALPPNKVMLPGAGGEDLNRPASGTQFNQQQ